MRLCVRFAAIGMTAGLLSCVWGCQTSHSPVEAEDEPALNTAVGELPEPKGDEPESPFSDFDAGTLSLDKYLKAREAENRPQTPSEERFAADHAESVQDPDPAFAIDVTPVPEPEPDLAPEPELTNAERIDLLSEELGELLQLQAVTSRDQYPELLKVAMLEVFTQEGMLDELLADGASTVRLTPAELEILAVFRDLLADAKHNKPERSAELIAEAAERLRAVRTLKIADAALCSRVLGFGRYDRISSSYTFVAGRRNPMIVYVQVEGFSHAPLEGESASDGTWIVELSEELALYHVSDGQAVWSRSAQGVRDRSRVKVRDFYLIQEIELPANLSVGRFNLKITVRDKNTGAIAEQLIPISVVADPGLAWGNH